MVTFDVSTEGATTILAVKGKLTTAVCNQFKEQFQKLLQEQKVDQLLTDLSELEFIASSGFRELFMAGKQIDRTSGKFAVCSLQGEVKRVFDLAGFQTAYPIYDDRTAALAQMNPPN